MKSKRTTRGSNVGRRERISPLTVKRLSLYLRCLEDLAGQGEPTVSSRQLAKALGLTSAQVRKDLAYFGQFGRPGVGYPVSDMAARLRKIFGTEEVWEVAVVGAGSIGRALLGFKRFGQKGFRLAAAFDSDPAKIGKKIGGVLVRPMGELASTIEKHRIRVAILAVPAGAAQAVAEALCQAGVKGILNFAPARLDVPEGIAVIPVDLAATLQQLSYFVNAGAGPAA